jgi:spore coat protein CotH
MKKKINLFIILAITVFLAAAAAFWIYSSNQSLTIGGISADLYNESKTVFIKLPPGSPTTQKVSFNFPLNNNNIYIKKLSFGPNTIENPIKEKLEDGKVYNFDQFVSHSKLIIRQGFKDIEYDLWITSGDVSILIIDVDGNIPNEPKIDAKISILSEGNLSNTIAVSAEIEQVDMNEAILKDSYSLNIKENILTGDVPVILDFEVSKRFTLTSSYLDKSFLRQKLAYDIFKSLSKDNISPETRYVELYLNGNYNGLYLLSRRPDRNMFSLPNFNKDDTTHSVLYEATNWRADFSRNIEGFSQIEPDYESDLSYFGPLEELIKYITESSEDEFMENIDDIIDMDYLIDNHLLFLLSGSKNELSSNQYLYRPNTPDAKFRISPGSYYATSFSMGDDSSKLDKEVINYGTRLYNRLYEDPEYRKKLKYRWNDLRKDILTTKTIYKIIDENVSVINEPQIRNFIKWPVAIDEYEDVFDFNEEIDYIKEFIDKRITYLDNYLNYPPLLKIGDNYALINEENNTIFCALPPGADTVQKISWHFSVFTEFSIRAVSYGEIGVYANDYNKYFEILENGENTNEATIFIDFIDTFPKINEKRSDLREKIVIRGRVQDLQNMNSMDIENILVFDGPSINKHTFIGEAAYIIPGFELNINSLLMENGLHDLYVYALYENGDYSLKIVPIEILNKNNEVDQIKDPQTISLENGGNFDFENFIFHGLLTIKNNKNIETYDLWITTGDIPLVVIDLDDQMINNEYRINGKINIMYHDSSEKNFINSHIFDLSEDLGIKIRGNSSQDFPKKQYSIEIIDDDGNELNASILGLPEESDWVLSAPYSDKTLIRNTLAYELGNQMGSYAPRTEFMELFINDREDLIIEGGYKGLYTLIERIKRDKDRINIERLNPDDIDISGGYVIEMNPLKRIKKYESYFTTNMGTAFIVKYPNEDKITLMQKEWITNYMNDFENSLYSDNFKDLNEGYKKYINVDSFIDYILLNELFQNIDVFWAGTYLYKDKGNKISIGPIWDFDASSGNHVFRADSPYIEFTGFDYLEKTWTEMLFKDNDFTTKYIARWKELRNSVLKNENIDSIIERNVEALSDARKRNFNKWDILGKYVWPNPEPYANTYEEEIEKLKKWFFERTKWIDDNIESLINYY